jgi:hypothetical protein
MQTDNELCILSQLFVIENMPYGGYSIVSKRLKIDGITGIKVKNIIRNLKKEPNVKVVSECCNFLKENGVEINLNCKNFLLSIKEKAEN